MMTHKKSNFRIRKAEMQDAPTLAEFNRLMAKETENKELDLDTVTRGVKAVIKDPHKGFFLVATIKGEIVGQLMVTNEWSDWRNQYFLWIQSVYVKESHRKQGVYAALYHYLKEVATDRKDVAGIRLYVEKFNESAQRTYERLGMQDPGYKMYETLV
jgi:GNAT superfamily N-acetyltransferase